jgi:hypothetical protein
VIRQDLLDIVTHCPRRKIATRAGYGGIWPIKPIVVWQYAMLEFFRAASSYSQPNQTNTTEVVLIESAEVIGDERQIRIGYCNDHQRVTMSANQFGEWGSLVGLLNFAPPVGYVERCTDNSRANKL